MIVHIITLLVLINISATFKNVLGIVGGFKIPIEKVPWQISLESNDSHICGGSIISPKFIITAAYCTKNSNETNFKIRAGTSIRGKGGQTIQVTQIWEHPNYNETTSDYNIAILELSEALKFDKSVAPIKLPKSGRKWFSKCRVLATGWGPLAEDDENLPEDLMGVYLNIVRHRICVKRYEKINVITERMICAGTPGGRKVSCGRDSGGPLTRRGILVGVESFGQGCGRKRFPGVYTNVAKVRDFVKEVTGL